MEVSEMVRGLVKTVMLSLLCVQSASAAVILMYHHIDADTPPATSVTPEQFAGNLDSLAAEGFEVVRLDELIERVRSGADPRQKLAAITFDDAYRSIYEAGLPALEARGWKGAVFINTGGVGEAGRAMTRAMIADAHQRGHLLLNHSQSHPHMVRRLPEETEQEWLARIRTDIESGRRQLGEWLGEQPLPWLAWPYGEQSAPLRAMLKDMGYLAFGQQSGALDEHIDWQNIPRIPVNGLHADWRSLRDKVLALPFPVRTTVPADGVTSEPRPSLTLLLNGDWRGRNIQCFAGPRFAAPTVRFSDGVSELTLRSEVDIPVGRSRYNCTAAAGDGRFHWYSWVWMRPDGEQWYAE
jgi:peptidoglycan/xylan/chitin deacetylase (PgdA/CDA1 family)